MEDRRARILVVDDDDGVTSILARGLRREGYDVATAPDADRALETVRGWKPDALVLDVLMPGTDGLELCRIVRAERPDAGIVLLTAKDSTADQVNGLDAGADDYLVKPFSLAVLAAHLRSVLRRRAPSAELLTESDLELDTGARRVRRGRREIALTRTEYRLLLQLLRQAGAVVAKRELAERVWGYDFGGNLNVLEVYVGYLREKLEAAGEPRLIHTVRGLGYSLHAAA
jgi:two-component system, OmpR family, response regulator MprA